MANTTADESVIIETSQDGSSFTVRDNPDYTTSPVSYTADPMSKGEKLGLGMFAVAFISLVGGLIVHDVKEGKRLSAEAEKRQEEMRRKREERQEWFDTQRREGRTVVETIDGEYMAIPNEAYQSAEIRKKAL